MDCPDLPPGQDGDFLLTEENAVGGGHGGRQKALPFQPDKGALAIALKEVRHLAGVLVHVGLHRHAVLRRRLEHRPEQLFADGGGRGDGVDGLQEAGEGAFHGPQAVHRRRDGRGPKALGAEGIVVGHDAEAAPEPRRLIDAGVNLRVLSPRVHKAGGAAGDHLYRRQLGAEAGALLVQTALKGDVDPLPNDGLLVQKPPPEELLAGVEMAVYQAGHPEKAGAGENRLRLVGALVLVHNVQDFTVLDGYGLSGNHGHVR